jgi:tol-pal system protein YbgF
MIRLAVAFCLALAVPAGAQESLADIRGELSALAGELARLRSETTTTGAAVPVIAGSALDRMNALEAELSRLTAKTEQLELRINRVVTDGTNRLGDLQFRICELDAECDIASLGQVAPLGGETGVASGGDRTGGAELAVGEKADFDRAKAALDSGSFRSAAELFAAFAEAYPGGPLSGQALYYRGEALIGQGDTANAARAWLQSFLDDPEGPLAPDALLKVGLALNTLGQAQESCATLGEVPARYPGTEAAGQADQARATMGCG